MTAHLPGLVTSITLGGVNLTLPVSEIMRKKSIYANMQMQIYTQVNNIDTIQQ
jgi:phosphoribosylcarboxyaminoimidazole (NCAIR) mutase